MKENILHSKKLKNTLRIAVFITLLCLILSYVNDVLKFNFTDGISQVDTFYSLENDTVDVLFIGSSHAFVNFNCGTLWDEYGISSYNLGGSMQPMWNTYYYLKEALKTQSPELIVLEALAVVLDDEYSDDSRIIKNTYGLKWSLDKVKAIEASTPEERWKDMLLDYTHYHNRYSELNRGDFIKNEFIRVDNQGQAYFNEWKGQFLFYQYNPNIVDDMTNVVERVELVEREEIYYRKIIELAKEKNIPILITVVPYGSDEIHQQRFNTAADIAEDYDVDFLNCNLIIDDMGLNYDTDYRDSSHMNCKGSQKFSRFFGGYIKSNYEISDRRGDDKYSGWAKNAEYTARFAHDSDLLNANDIESLSSLLVDDKFILFVSVDGTCTTEDAVLAELFESLGITDGQTAGVWYLNGNKKEWDSEEESEYYFSNEMHDFLLERKIDAVNGGFINRIVVDNVEKKAVYSGLNIVVYDKVLQTVIDCIGIENYGYTIIHNVEIDKY